MWQTWRKPVPDSKGAELSAEDLAKIQSHLLQANGMLWLRVWEATWSEESFGVVEDGSCRIAGDVAFETCWLAV